MPGDDSPMQNTRRWLTLPFLGAAGWLSAQAKPKAAKGVRIYNPPAIAKPTGYSHVAEVSAGKTVYIAGQIALDRNGQTVGPDNFAAQVQQVFENLNEAVKAAGGTFHDVVKVNCFLADRVERSQIPALREIRDRYVNPQAPPVSTLLFVRGLVREEWLIEVEAVAVIAG